MKKKKSDMSDVEKDAKKSVLGELRQTADDMMKDKLSGLKKVTVASDSPEGLEEGLEKVKLQRLQRKQWSFFEIIAIKRKYFGHCGVECLEIINLLKSKLKKVKDWQQIYTSEGCFIYTPIPITPPIQMTELKRAKQKI